jgi:hypothetical protein
MNRTSVVALAALLALTAPMSAAGLTGHYLEVRTCDVWTGPCFANAEMNLGGKNGMMAWKIDKGSFDEVALDGLGVVAVVGASDTLGLKQTGTAKAVVIVDSRATSTQREALVRLVKRQGGELLRNVVAVQQAEVKLDICECTGGGCATLDAGPARIRTRCVDHKQDKICGNEGAFYPPLTPDVKVRPAIAVENAFTGKGVNETWSDGGRRGAYLGSFSIR